VKMCRLFILETFSLNRAAGGLVIETVSLNFRGKYRTNLNESTTNEVKSSLWLNIYLFF